MSEAAPWNPKPQTPSPDISGLLTNANGRAVGSAKYHYMGSSLNWGPFSGPLYMGAVL